MPDSLVDLFESYRRKRLRGCSPDTIRRYHITFRAFSKHLGYDPTTDDLNDDAVADFCWAVVESGRSASTGRKHGLNLCAIWRFACRQGIVKKWPECEIPKNPERSPIAWTRPQLKTLFEACKNQPGWVDGVRASGWWQSLHAVIWDTGERISAVLSIKWDNVDLDDGWLLIDAEQRKGKTRDKRWKLHADTVALLRAITQPEREMVFPFPYCEASLWNQYRRLLKGAGLPHDRKHKFHCLRKSVGSYFEASGGSAMSLLDHSSRKVTQAYLDPRIVKDVQASDVLFRPADVKIEKSEPPRKPDVSEWQFAEISVCFRGVWFSMNERQCTILRTLAEAPGEVEFESLAAAVWPNGSRPKRPAVQLSNISTSISAVRDKLRSVLGINEQFDPVPNDYRGAGGDRGKWTLLFPPVVKEGEA